MCSVTGAGEGAERQAQGQDCPGDECFSFSGKPHSVLNHSMLTILKNMLPAVGGPRKGNSQSHFERVKSGCRFSSDFFTVTK